MAFPTIPTVAAGRVLFALNTNPAGTHTSPNLSSLTKNNGDLLIAICIIYDGNSTNAEFSSWGGGFTERADQAGTATMGIGVASKVSDGTETGTFTVTSADTSANDSCFILLSIPGAHDTTPPEAGTMATGTGAAADPGSFNPTGWDAEDTLWIAVAGSGETSTTGSYTGVASAPANYTDYADSGISADVVGGVEGAVAFRQLNAASEDPGTFSVDTSNARNAAILIAVRPAAAVNVEGSQSSTEADDTVSASGTVTVAGTQASTEADDTAAASGTVEIVGTQASTEANDTADASGEVEITGVDGSQASTEEDDGAAASGTVTVAGTQASTEQDDTASASGTLTVAGTQASTEADDTAAASGAVVQNVEGTQASTEQDDAAAASGLVLQDVTGTQASTEQDDTASASGTVQLPASTFATVGATTRARHTAGARTRGAFTTGAQ